jgi:hypothetical protein
MRIPLVKKRYIKPKTKNADREFRKDSTGQLHVHLQISPQLQAYPEYKQHNNYHQTKPPAFPLPGKALTIQTRITRSPSAESTNARIQRSANIFFAA